MLRLRGRRAAGIGILAGALGAVWIAAGVRGVQAGTRQPGVGNFAFELEVSLPGSPEEIYDAFTGDVSGWWDHTFSESPERLYIEAKPGGGFYEIFDDAGNGARHAVVIYAERGKLLRFDGPLGLSGRALQMVHTFTFEPVGGGTRLELSLHASGELEEGLADAVNRVWNHFLVG